MFTVASDLVSWIYERLEADSTLDDSVGLIVLTALEGDKQLDEYLENHSSNLSREPHAGTVADPATGTFMRSLQVAGFRGIGPRVALTLEPAPGLTVIAGRNGSGKSSLAEGLELLLTGETYRWKNKKSTQWSECWRNLHHDGDAEIVAEFIEEGTGPIRIRTEWPATATNVSQFRTTAQRTVDGTRGPTQDASALGWKSALQTFRPMLSYDELGGLLESGPSELYDAIAKVLGTEQLADAVARIKTRLALLSAPQKAAATDRRSLQTAAGELPDERAQAVALLLRKVNPDTHAIRAVVTGLAVPDRGVVASLRGLSQLPSPRPSAIADAAERLRSAVARMAEVGEADAARRVARLDLRRQALQLHAEYGEQSCPVCSQGTLDDKWSELSRNRIASEELELKELSSAGRELEIARRELRSLVMKRPAATDRAPINALEDVLTDVRAAWDALEAAPQGDLELARHLERHSTSLELAMQTMRVEATKALAERDDAWSPLASKISSWCETWEEALKSKPAVDQLTAAEKWLKENDTRLKNERIAPISDQAKHVWSLLRQESNVDLGDLRLEGQATRRRVTITATIDGEEAGGALPVMSQGELHALALALFLPRASLEDSPFRFLILDDPVQAMDPAKVDGLVAVLTEIAKTRQVVVFSHDDRLPAAVRRLNSSGRVYEVVRGPNSELKISPAENPAARYLSDAEALCKDAHVPDETLRRTLPGLLRMAIEAAARDRFYSHRLVRGAPLHEVESAWNSTHGTSQRVSLAIYDEIRPLSDWLRTEARKKGLGIATSGFHKGLYVETDPQDAIYQTRRMVEEIRIGSK